QDTSRDHRESRTYRRGRPSLRLIDYAYDANGNVTAVTPPSKPPHGFSFNLVDQISDYVPPVVGGSGHTRTRYFYNLDRQPTQILRPDEQTIDFGYDTAGQLK